MNIPWFIKINIRCNDFMETLEQRCYERLFVLLKRINV